jgi:hypothetical protein
MTALFRNTATLTAARLGLATPPMWARNADTKADAGEAWGLATDPHNERGEECTAYFDYAQVWTEYASANPSVFSEGWESKPILQGVAVTGGTAGNFTTTYHTRADLVARLGDAWVEQVEGVAE